MAVRLVKGNDLSMRQCSGMSLERKIGGTRRERIWLVGWAWLRRPSFANYRKGRAGTSTTSGSVS